LEPGISLPVDQLEATNGPSPLKIEFDTRREARPRAEPVAARGRAGSSVFIVGGVLMFVTTPLQNPLNVFPYQIQCRPRRA
jgi:hypothetical protein